MVLCQTDGMAKFVGRPAPGKKVEIHPHLVQQYERQSVPIFDHAPSAGSKAMRNSASCALLNSNRRLACSVHHRACSFTRTCYAGGGPLMKRTRNVDSLIHIFLGTITARRASPVVAHLENIRYVFPLQQACRTIGSD
jgi:hypothetical protein